MSADPEAIIYYGFPLEDYEDEEYSYHDRNDEWEQLKRPEQPADKGNYRTPEWDAWREKMAIWSKSPENIEIEWSGGENCEAYYIHASGLKHSVEWNEQKPLAGISFESQPEADEQLRQFCEKFGIEWKQPGWHLAARYF
jgi:hypothetical protein